MKNALSRSYPAARSRMRSRRSSSSRVSGVVLTSPDYARGSSARGAGAAGSGAPTVAGSGGSGGAVTAWEWRRPRVASRTISDHDGTGHERDQQPRQHHAERDAEPGREARRAPSSRRQAAPEVVGLRVGSDRLGHEVDRDRREVDLVDEPVALLREAVELRLPGRELRLDRDEVGDRRRLAEQLLQPVDRGGERLDAPVEVVALLRDIRGVHRHRVHGAERAQLVDERVELVGGDAQRERGARRLGVGARALGAAVDPAAGLLGEVGRLLGGDDGVVDRDRDPARGDDAAIGELRLGVAAGRAVWPTSPSTVPGSGATPPAGVSTMGALDSPAPSGAAGEEQCGDRGRCRRGCESSHGHTVLPGPNPMSGPRLGVGSRSDCASL